jgi:hypothetical protein
MEMAPASEPLDLAADMRHVATTAIPTPANAATPTTTSTPANTAAPAAYETTTTRERLDHVKDVRHVTIPAAAQLETNSIKPTLDSTAPIATPTTSPTIAPTLSPAQTTATDPSSNAAAELTAVITRTIVKQRSTKQPDNEENGGSTEGEEDERQQRREKEGKGVEKEDRASERQNERREASTGEQEVIKEIRDEVRDHAPPTTASTAVNPVLHGHARFDWAMDADSLIGPVPSARDFRPTAPVAANPNRTPNRCIPATSAPTNNAPTLVNPNPSDVACIPYPAGIMPFPVNPKPIAPNDPVPSVLNTPVSPMVYGPRDLSALRSGMSNPWGSLRRRHYGRDPHVPHQFTCRRQHRQRYPANTYVPAIPTLKPPTPAPICIFETVRHPHGIGPNKPVIRVPARMEMATSTHPALSDQAIVKSAPPLHPPASVQCRCGQLVPVSGNQVFRSFPLHHAFSSFISQFISLSFPFPRQLFSR